jgi:N-acetylglucosamine kinase-like BadF-type ATPase
VNIFLGVDGGGTKTDFLLIDSSGSVLARRREGSSYYLEIGIENLQSMLIDGIRAILSVVSLAPADITYAFLGLPAYGENTSLLPRLDSLAEAILPRQRYRCANDVVCGWAGALGGCHGVAVVAGTGSIAYGEYASHSARAGGWGELFSDEGSAFWVAREALNLFSRMSDGRMEKSLLYGILREHFGVASDLDVCAAVHGPPGLSRSEIAALSHLVAKAARKGDPSALKIFDKASQELAALVHAVRDSLGTPPDVCLPASYCGGMLERDSVMLPLFARALHAGERRYALTAPRLPPSAGAALRAAALAGAPLGADAINHLARTHADREHDCPP